MILSEEQEQEQDDQQNDCKARPRTRRRRHWSTRRQVRGWSNMVEQVGALWDLILPMVYLMRHAAGCESRPNRDTWGTLGFGGWING